MSRLRERNMQRSIGRNVKLANAIERLPKNKTNLGKIIKVKARLNVHVITGFLKSTIDVFGEDEKSITVGASANYARFEEEGTSTRPPHPFMAPAIRDGKKWLRQMIREQTRIS